MVKDYVEIVEDSTVGEFIEMLQKFPQDLPIRVNYEKGFTIWRSDDYLDGDGANPECPVIEAVVVV